MNSTRRLFAVLLIHVITAVAALPALAHQPCPPADGEIVGVLKAPDGSFDVHVSARGGVLKAVILHDKQFHQTAREPFKGTVQPPSQKIAEGPLDLVSTWDNAFLPLTIAFEDPSPLSMGRLVKVVTPPVAAPAAGAELAAPAVDASAEPAAVANEPQPAPVETWTTEPVDFWKEYQQNPDYRVVQATDSRIVMVWPDPARFSSPLYIERTYSIGERYLLDATIRLISLSESEIAGTMRLSVSAWESAAASGGYCGGMFGAPPDLLQAVCGTSKDVDLKNRKDILDNKGFEITESASYVGVSSRYFLSAVLPGSGNVAQCVASASEVGVVTALIRWGNESGGNQLIKAVRGTPCIPDWLVGAHGMEGRLTCSQAASVLGVDPGIGIVELSEMKEDGLDPDKAAARQVLMARRDRLVNFKFFSGPKDLGLLRSMSAGVENTIDFGWFGVLAKPMLWLMRVAHSVVPSWGLAIIFLTIIVKLITLPFTHSSMKQMRRMSELKPRIDELQKKHKDDKVALNQATMELYKREKINPLGGCLPMLIQMPIWIALYRTIYSAVDLYQAPLGLWIADLSSRDPYFVLPVLLGVIMWVNQKITPVSGDPTQAKIMLWMMPIMFSAMMMFLPSGLVFYILINTVLSVFHTLWNNRGLRRKAVAG